MCSSDLTLLLTPLALLYLLWLEQQNQLTFLSASVGTSWLLVAAGIITSLPLICFAAGARRLTLTLIGLLQYTAPTITFILAIAVYHEPLDANRLVTFALIWTGLILFTAEGLWQSKKISVKPFETV